MKAIDLFCGTGGFALGAERAGFDVVASFDIDPNLTFSHHLNFPSTKLNLQDIATLNGDWIVENFGQDVQLIIGGPPCQGFSMMGARDVSDPRRTLLMDFFRVVSEVKPSVFVMENVEGLLHRDARSVLDSALEYVSDYTVLDPMVLDAADFGAPTRRRRTFVIGYDHKRCNQLSADMFKLSSLVKNTVEEAFCGLNSASKLAKNEMGFDQRKIRKNAALSSYANSLIAEDRCFSGDQRTKHTKAVVERFAKVEPGKSDPVGKHYRLKLDGLCPTLRAGTGSEKGSYQSVRPIHPTEDRVITVREAARLQGFPDSHLFHPTIWHSFRQIGNSVSPIISYEILRIISEALLSSTIQLEAAE